MKFAITFLFWCTIFTCSDIIFDYWLSFDYKWQKYLFELVFLFGACCWIMFFSKRTYTITIANKALLVKKLNSYSVIKTTDGQVFKNHNEFLFKKNAQELDKQLKVGHRYKITTYKTDLFSERNILFAREIKSPIRKKSGKKSK